MAENADNIDSGRTDSGLVVSLRTGDLDLREGRSEWQDALANVYAEMDVAWPTDRGGLDAEWGGRPLGELHVSSIRCEEQSVIRSPAMIESDCCADFLVCVVTDGEVELDQAGRSATVARGSFVLLNLAAPFVFRASATFRQVVVRIPASMIAGRLPDAVVDQTTAHAFGPDHSATGVVGRFLTDLARVQMTPSEAVPFASSAVEMLSAAVLAARPPASQSESFRARDLARIRQVISEHLHDAELTVPDIARLSAISLRSVQKLAQESGSTPSRWLYDARIERAKQLLGSTRDPVAVVSERVGFRDVSHFGRVFRQQAGISPGRFRSEIVAGR